MKTKRMEIIFVIVVIIIVVFTLFSFTYPSGENVNTSKQKIKATNLIPYIIDKNPEKTKLIAHEQSKLFPPLRPERFRRRVKMLWGVDINDYPENAKIKFSPWDIILSKKFQTLEHKRSIYAEDAPFTLLDHPESTYQIFLEYILYNDPDSFNKLITYTNQAVDSVLPDKSYLDMEIYANNDLLNGFYYNALFNASRHLIEHLDKYPYFGLMTFDNSPFVPRPTDSRLDALFIFIKKELQKGRRFDNKNSDWIDLKLNFEEFPLYDGNNYMKSYLSAVAFYNGSEKNNEVTLSSNTHIPWVNYSSERGMSALLSFFLLFNNKTQNKFVIQYISGQVDRYLPNSSEQKTIRTAIKVNNYYGYSILREFCENPMREMPTLEKIGTNFKAKVNKPNSLLLLEPFVDSYDIDTIQPTENFVAYEMGHDDYYFIEIEKPVESPIVGKDGYAIILDRKETVYGYLPKSIVKKYTLQEVLSETQYTDKARSKQGIITDKDGYVNIRKEPNSQSEIIGKISDKEKFQYWETPENWYIIETSSGVRGYVYKDRIREKYDTRGWILNDE